MNRLMTSGGRTIPCSFFGTVNSGAVVIEAETDFVTAAKVFSDASETSEIYYIYEKDGEEAVRKVTGYTALLSLTSIYGSNSGVRIMLQPPIVDMEEII